MTIEIRPAVESDVDAMLAFVKELAAYEKLSQDVVSNTDRIRAAFFCDAPKVYALIAELDGAPVGIAVYFFNFSTYRGRHGVYLEELYVQQEVRGHGVGKQLLCELAAIAIRNNCERFEWIVLQWNESAIRFYESLGGIALDEWKRFRLSGDALHRLAEGAA